MKPVTVLLALALAPFAVGAQPSVETGRRSYEVCAGCHGFQAEGNALVRAPSLAGLPTWYLERQMRNFTTGLRGAASGDTHGARMAIMARAASRERELGDLLTYIGTLPTRRGGQTAAGRGVLAALGQSMAPMPGAKSAASIDGNAANGAQQYALCAACHGQAGEGNEALGAPLLTALDDWYVVDQLRLYAEGLRGQHPDDTYGQQMRAIANGFVDEQTRRDLAAYLRSLRP